jgi:hypothetical protein
MKHKSLPTEKGRTAKAVTGRGCVGQAFRTEHKGAIAQQSGAYVEEMRKPGRPARSSEA